MEEWKLELFLTGIMNAMDDREAFRDRDDDDYSESVREGLRRWRRVAGAQYEAALAAAASGDRARADADAAPVHEPPLPPAPCQVSQL
ncbi:flavin-containing monooxygenase FMO GS-OX-like 8 [Panicum miliaceum]|uniref:Flavin-containing monooxygenase FMO GS-OX-like 8 n=1 Tax=Panicum miliaceum TaxID=4540 RepID=A0A3L6QQ46_PANMI|nr:flavin-containing monooxygenase FMO GS-OX-like 8 [Panicum miliaceum]